MQSLHVSQIAKKTPIFRRAFGAAKNININKHLIYVHDFKYSSDLRAHFKYTFDLRARFSKFVRVTCKVFKVRKSYVQGFQSS